METPDPPNDTPGASKQVVLTPHDIPRSHQPKRLMGLKIDVHEDAEPRSIAKRTMITQVTLGFLG